MQSSVPAPSFRRPPASLARTLPGTSRSVGRTLWIQAHWARESQEAKPGRLAALSSPGSECQHAPSREQEGCQAKSAGLWLPCPEAASQSPPGFVLCFSFLFSTDQHLPLNILSRDNEVFLFVTIWGGVLSGGGAKINLGYFGAMGEEQAGTEPGSWGGGRPQVPGVHPWTVLS